MPTVFADKQGKKQAPIHKLEMAENLLCPQAITTNVLRVTSKDASSQAEPLLDLACIDTVVDFPGSSCAICSKTPRPRRIYTTMALLASY
jgi:hypothetical protein